MKIANPVADPPWECGILLGMPDVKRAIDEKSFLQDLVPENSQSSYELHAMRIAWHATAGWTDPIEIDVGVPGLGYRPEWPILDGNHRLYAAVARGDVNIDCSISGCLDFAKELFFA